MQSLFEALAVGKVTNDCRGEGEVAKMNDVFDFRGTTIRVLSWRGDLN